MYLSLCFRKSSISLRRLLFTRSISEPYLTLFVGGRRRRRFSCSARVQHPSEKRRLQPPSHQPGEPVLAVAFEVTPPRDVPLRRQPRRRRRTPQGGGGPRTRRRSCFPGQQQRPHPPPHRDSQDGGKTESTAF